MYSSLIFKIKYLVVFIHYGINMVLSDSYPIQGALQQPEFRRI